MQPRTFQIFDPQGCPLAYHPWGISHPEGSILNGQSKYEL